MAQNILVTAVGSGIGKRAATPPASAVIRATGGTVEAKNRPRATGGSLGTGDAGGSGTRARRWRQPRLLPVELVSKTYRLPPRRDRPGRSPGAHTSACG